MEATATVVRVTCKRCGQACELTGCVCGYPELGRPDRDVTVKRIKAALVRRSGVQWSVTGGRGTGYGWIRISVPKARFGCERKHDFGWQDNVCATCGLHRNHGYTIEDEDERRAFVRSCAAHACTDQCYGGYITPEDQAALETLLGLGSVHPQGVSIMASTDAYIEYIDRAEGRKPRTIGVPYWD